MAGKLRQFSVLKRHADAGQRAMRLMRECGFGSLAAFEAAVRSRFDVVGEARPEEVVLKWAHGAKKYAAEQSVDPVAVEAWLRNGRLGGDTERAITKADVDAYLTPAGPADE